MTRSRIDFGSVGKISYSSSILLSWGLRLAQSASRGGIVAHGNSSYKLGLHSAKCTTSGGLDTAIASERGCHHRGDDHRGGLQQQGCRGVVYGVCGRLSCTLLWWVVWGGWIDNILARTTVANCCTNRRHRTNPGTRAEPQQIVAQRLLSCLQYPVPFKSSTRDLTRPTFNSVVK